MTLARAAFVSLLVVGFVGISSSACSTSTVATNPASDGGVPNEDGGETNEDSGKQASSEKVTVTDETLSVDGSDHQYTLAVPKSYSASKKYALVLVLHGDGGDGPGMRSFHTFDAESGDDAIVAYPSGAGAGWDIYTPLASNSDQKFIEQLVQSLSEKYSIDPARVFGTGYSSGAFLINQMACRKTGFFRAIVPHAGGAPHESDDPEATTWPNGATKCNGQTGGIAVMVFHGDGDTTVTPDSGDYTAQYWAQINECGESRVATTPEPCQRYEGCPSDKPSIYCQIPGLGHTVWENGAKYAWEFMKSL